MRLMTEMKQCADGMVCVSKGIDMQADREHDAAVAHALMQSLETHLQIFSGTSHMDLLEVKLRADELLREWGYGDECG